MNEAIIQVKNISKVFMIPEENRNTLREHFWNFFRPMKHKKFQALDNVSFEVNRGEWLGIIGRNGSGKSTLLKILAGIYLPDSGRFCRNGSLVPFLELGVGFNFELSARENIFLNGTILGMTRKEINAVFDAIVEFAEIKEFLDLPLKNYSSGMKVRLAFAIATKVDADIYLLDEVMAVGDYVFKEKCTSVFEEMKEKGKTIIFVSHSMDDIKRYCDKALIIKKGVLDKFGDADTITSLYEVQE